MVVVKPGTTTPHTEFDGQVYILSKDEGGRHTPFFNNYRPQFYFRTTDVTGVVTLPSGTEMVMPGDNTVMSVKLIQPIAMEEGLQFAIREGGRTVGAGQVTKIVQVAVPRSGRPHIGCGILDGLRVGLGKRSVSIRCMPSLGAEPPSTVIPGSLWQTPQGSAGDPGTGPGSERDTPDLGDRSHQGETPAG